MSEDADPVDVLEQALAGAGDDLVRAYVSRIGGARPRVQIGKSLELRRDRSVLDQLVDHVRANATDGGGFFEVKLKIGNTHLASARVPIEFPEGSSPASDRASGRSAAVPGRGDDVPDDEIVDRVPNPSAARDPLDVLLEQAEKFRKLKAAFADPPDDADDDDDDADDDDDGDGDDGEDLEKPVESLIEGLAGFVASEAGKATAGRLLNAFADRLEAGTEVAKAKAAVLVAHAAGKVGLSGSLDDPKAEPPASAPTKPADGRPAPRAVRVIVNEEPTG